jgi:hypothetical protein
MKKIIATIIIFTLLLNITTTAFADAPSLNVTTTISPTSTNSDPIILEQGQTLTLTATTTMADSGNATVSSEEWIGAEVITPASGSGVKFVSTALFSSVGKNIGTTYTVKYTITLQRGGGEGNVNGSDSDETYIEVIEEEQTIYIAPMAAPAVAAKILQYNEVQPGYKIGKTAGNFIKDVAQKMGPQTMFADAEKSIWDNGQEISNPAYREAVLEYLNSLSNMPKTLDMPYDSYFLAP